MERTTISLPRDLIVRLRVIAAERRVSMAQVIREALEEKAKQPRPQSKSIGSGDSGHTDTSEILSQGSPPPVSWR